MELSEESAVNQEKKERESERMVVEKKTAADYFPFFFLGFLSPRCYFSSVFTVRQAW